MNNQLIPQQTFSSSSIINIYKTGEYYKDYIFDDQYYPYKYDGWYDRNRYGIYDLQNNVIYPRPSSLLEYTNNTGNSHRNIKFVADAFKDLKNYFSKLSKNNNLNPKSIFTKLNVEGSTESVPNLFLAEVNKINDLFYNTYLSSDIKSKIVDITTFMPYYIKFLTVLSKVTPVNRSTYIKSRKVPSSVNGLRITLDTVAKNNNYISKANDYIGNPEFDHFVASTSKFGFFVDKNYPYDIVADLDSAVMRDYARKRGYYSLEDIFSKCYFRAYEVDIETLRNTVLIAWNTFALAQQTQVVSKQKIGTELVYYNELTPEVYEKFYNINWHIRLYLYTRILEDRVAVPQSKFENMYAEAIKINKFSDISNATLYINQKILELNTPQEELPPHLTTSDAIVRMLSNNIDPLPVENINF